MKRILAGRHASFAIAVLALVLAAGGGAYAAGGGGSTITACVKKHGGTFYSAKKCAKGDRKLTWSQAGPQGGQGPQGPKGDTGNTGNTGNTGPQGPGAATIDATIPTGTNSPTAIGTINGMTLYSACQLSSGVKSAPLDVVLPGSGWTATGHLNLQWTESQTVTSGTGSYNEPMPTDTFFVSGENTGSTPANLITVNTTTAPNDDQQATVVMHFVNGSTGYTASFEVHTGGIAACQFVGDIVQSS